jgi:sugar phosphate isomerase/epimerase
MPRTAKISRGTWCVAFGFDPVPSLDQALEVMSAFGYDGVEIGGFLDHATIERYPDSASRQQLVDRVKELDLEVCGYAPGPYGDFGRLPWATGDEDVVKAYDQFFEDHLRFTVDIGSPAMRVDPGDFGPLPRDADYDKAWDRVVETFRKHAQRGREEGVLMLWEYETGQIFVKPSEVVKLLEDVGDDNLKLLYDVGHVEAGFGKGVIDFDEVIPALLKAGYEGDWWAVDAIPMTSESWADTWDGRIWLDAALDKHVRG